MNIYLVNAGKHQMEAWSPAELLFDLVAAETRGKARALFVDRYRKFVDFTDPMRICKIATFTMFDIPEGIVADDTEIPDEWFEKPQVKRTLAWFGENEE